MPCIALQLVPNITFKLAAYYCCPIETPQQPQLSYTSFIECSIAAEMPAMSHWLPQCCGIGKAMI